MEKNFKIGIHCNNYKLERFKSELGKNNYMDLKIVPNTKDETTFIFINVTQADSEKATEEVNKICREVEAFYRAQKN